jgi:hypothetical protein
MPRSLDELLGAYRAQIDWLLAQAEEIEAGKRGVLCHVEDATIDVSPSIAIEYRHHAGNMRAIVQALERLSAREASQP